MGIYIIELSILKGTYVCNLFKYEAVSSNIVRHLPNISHIIPSSSFLIKTNKLFFIKHSMHNSTKSYKFKMFNISYELSFVISENSFNFGKILFSKNCNVALTFNFCSLMILYSFILIFSEYFFI